MWGFVGFFSGFRWLVGFFLFVLFGGLFSILLGPFCFLLGFFFGYFSFVCMSLACF